MLYETRKNTRSLMRCVAVKEARGPGAIVWLHDDKGRVRVACNGPYAGLFFRAFGLPRNADLALACGKQVKVSFGPNGDPNLWHSGLLGD